MQKRVVAIHDISCIGKCSLTVALPIISAAGIETSVIPTAILSTHTGGFSGYTFLDLTNEIEKIVNHWKTLNTNFDAFYTGYLGSLEQINIVKGVINDLKQENTLIMVDPVMADNGKLYPAFDEQFPLHMKELCSVANLIVPNITEACLMLGKNYIEGPYTKGYIEELLIELSKLGPRMVVLTGVYFNNDKLGAASYDSKEGQFSYYLEERIDGYYHGTGDVFGSALLSALLKGKTLEESIKVAVDFTVGSIKRTKEAETDIKYGVDFESGLGDLATILK